VTRVTSALRPSIYWLLVFVPISLGAAVLGNQPVVVFATSCLAIIPLAGLILRATDQLALRSGPRVGGLLNATFANVPELIIGILLVRAGEYDVVKASLVGSIVGNLMLVLGASYLAGGIRYKQQRFSARSAGVHSASLLLAVAGLVMPAVFVAAARETPSQVELVSLAVAGTLITLYVASLVFTFGTHSYLFQIRQAEEQPDWSVAQATGVLLVAALLVGLTSELLVRSLEPTVQALGISKIWIGMFVVAIVGNAAEHASAILFALRNKMDVAIEITFSSSTQVALLVTPLLVFISLFIGPHGLMDFVFPLFELATVTLATLLVAVITHDGRSNWLEGLQLLGVYGIVAVSLFYVQKP
jgi:Ca2+:H+ antiporter